MAKYNIKKKLILLTNEQLSLYKRLEIEYFSKKLNQKYLIYQIKI